MPDVQGLSRLQKKLRTMPDRARTVMRKALEKGAQEIVDAQKSLARTSRRSGHMIESDGWRDGDHDLQVIVFNDAFYSRYVEFGTSHSTAEPFFFPAYRLLRKRVKAAIRYSSTKAVREVSRGSV